MDGREETLLLKRRWFAIAAAMIFVVGCEGKKVLAPGPQPPANSAEFVQVLAEVYRTQNFATFTVLLAEDFLFILDEPNPETLETQWDAATERRIHSLMFDPQNSQPVVPPLPLEVWLQSVNVTLSLQDTFVERPELYTTFDPPGNLDPIRWKAESAIFGTNVFFQLQGETDYQITGRADFTIIEDRAKQVGDSGKFLLLRWEDLGPELAPATERATWSGVKELYRR